MVPSFSETWVQHFIKVAITGKLSHYIGAPAQNALRMCCMLHVTRVKWVFEGSCVLFSANYFFFEKKQLLKTKANKISVNSFDKWMHNNRQTVIFPFDYYLAIKMYNDGMPSSGLCSKPLVVFWPPAAETARFLNQATSPKGRAAREAGCRSRQQPRRWLAWRRPGTVPQGPTALSTGNTAS